MAALSAFAAAVALYRGVRAFRFPAALVLGALCAHAGWGALHWQALRAHPAALLDPTFGYCVLFVPLGPLLLAREAASWRALPLAFALARLGCLTAGCVGTSAALAELLVLPCLHVALGRVSNTHAGPIFLAGFALTRLATQSLRSPPEPTDGVDPGLLLPAAWLAVAAVWERTRARRAGSAW